MENNHAVYSRKTKLYRSFSWLFMLVLAAIIIFPVSYIIFGSFKGNSELLVGGSNIFPKTIGDVSSVFLLSRGRQNGIVLDLSYSIKEKIGGILPLEKIDIKRIGKKDFT